MKTWRGFNPFRWCGVISVLFWILSFGISEGANRIGSPDGVFYHRFASSVYGPEAVWVNPAGLGLYKDFTVQYVGEYCDGTFMENWGLVTSEGGGAIGYRTRDDFLGDKLQEYIFAAGVGIGEGTFLGGSYRYLKEGPGIYNRRHFWNIGVIFRQNPKFSVAALFSNLNRGKVNGERTDIEQLYSLTYHQLNHRLLLSMEITLSTGQSLSGASYNYGVDIRPHPRIGVYFNRDNHDNFQFGVKIYLRRCFTGGQTRFGSAGDHLGSSLFGGFVYPRKK
ncbi:MAG: hypothetical protein JSV44_12565 [Candidatus Zixiibacteriota bacterium]|nr:MAG: hypothetical protein JSV44_12565 [candidate division Zixibacteria bacterium]